MNIFGRPTVVEETPQVYSTRDYQLGGAAVIVLLSILVPITLASGGLLLFISPLLLLFSPILVPLLLVSATLIGGAFLLALGGYWLYKYNTGGRPYLSDQADVVVAKGSDLYHKSADKAKDLSSHAQGRVQDLTTYAQSKANEGYGYINSKISPAA